MPTMAEIGWLILRVGYGLLFLNAAWECGKSAEARKWTEEETSILVPRFAKLFSLAGIAIMGLGGLSILLGVLPRVGGAMLAVFVLGGAVIHFRQMGRVDRMCSEIGSKLPPGNDALLTTLQVSARLGHKSSALKNLALAAVGLFFVFNGSGPHSLWA